MGNSSFLITVYLHLVPLSCSGCEVILKFDRIMDHRVLYIGHAGSRVHPACHENPTKLYFRITSHPLQAYT